MPALLQNNIYHSPSQALSSNRRHTCHLGTPIFYGPTTMKMGHDWDGIGVGVGVGVWEPENKLKVVVGVSKYLKK